ncbi:NACHT and WD40 domain protein [Penicillium cosmopolitanum]|uniref:NACHT and WD40 domain protein n=1 Tax=Penicillium cosmopolitanum TaxID=1131564 RepID=A0A9W9VD97_9EURO|nr:NACHT and WD40 domain protein [Penicillium cosmopolitanum]KAJ5376494.1 NACHT and WD40 domain protein [Penicillium cosmopolitanum]
MEFDRLPAVFDAQFDSYINQHDEFCLRGTRTGVIDEISQWVNSPTGKPIFWLNGMAGTGKSTITRTLARDFKESNLLGASFFFKRGESNRGSMQWLLPTIAKQLAQSVPELRPGILNAVREDPDIATKGLPEQFDKLVLEPLIGVINSCRLSPIVIVIDALDECETQNDVEILLRLLPRIGQSKHMIARVFLTSRPEILIRLGFSEISNDARDLVLHQIPEEATEHDITLFLRHQMASIRRERLLPANWPNEKDLLDLTKLSVPLFIFAATMCRLFQDHQLDPVVCLSEVLSYGGEGSQLHGTYMPVLNRILDTRANKERVAEEFRAVVGAIILLDSSLSIASLSNLINIPESVIDTRLNSLHSVIRIPKERNMPLRLFHLSFRDFLLHPDTKKKSLLWIDEEDGHSNLALKCLALCRSLRRNICSLPSDGTLRKEIDQRTIDKCFSPETKYSCRFWAHHVKKSGDMMLLTREGFQFLREHFLHWLEAMNLLGLGSEAVSIIQDLKSDKIEKSEMYSFLREGERFAVNNQFIADKAPLQLYNSALIFAPKNSILRDLYRHEFPQWLKLLPEVNKLWEAGSRRLEGHKGEDDLELSHIAFSHDSQMIASCGSRRGILNDIHAVRHTIWVWHATTGVVQHTLSLQFDRTHGNVSSIAFAPDNQLLACRFEEGDVIVYDLIQRTVINTLLSPGLLRAMPRVFTTTTSLEAIRGVSPISKDGRKIAYSPLGEPIQIWNPLTSEKIHQSPFNNVGPITISSDGRLVASCLFYNIHKASSNIFNSSSNEGETEVFVQAGYQLERRADVVTALKIWDTVTGTTEVMDSPFNHSTSVLQPLSFPHNSDYFDCGYWPRLTFSPNGQILAVQSNPFIQLWDIPKKALKWKLKGNSDYLAFSFDDILLASGTRFNTIRVWNLVSGTLQHVFCDFGGLISLTLSPNGYILASKSSDGIIQLRDLGVICEETVSDVFEWFEDDRRRQVILRPSEFSSFNPPSPFSKSNYRTQHPLVKKGKLQASSSPSPQNIRLMAISPDCRLLVSLVYTMNEDPWAQLWDISEDMTFSLWNMAQGSIAHIDLISMSHLDVDPHEGKSVWVLDPLVAFSRNGRVAYTGPNSDGRLAINLCETTSGMLCHVLNSQSSGFRLLCFSPDGQSLAAVTSHKKISVWDVNSGRLSHNFDEKEFINKIQFTVDSSVLISNLEPSRPQDCPMHLIGHLKGLSWDMSVTLRDEWISHRGEDILWLPSEFRPHFDVLVVKNTLIMAHITGQVSFMGFDFTHLHGSSANTEVRRDL